MTKPLHLNPDWMKQKYVVEGLSTYDIAKIVSRDPKRIYEKLKDFGIPTRPRGENLKGLDNYMKQDGVENPFKGRSHSVATKKLLSQKASVPKPHLQGKRNGMYNRVGSLNPRYIDGSSPERQRLYVSLEWKALIKTVYERDNYRCVRCGSEKRGNRSLHAHHLKSWAGNPDLRFDISNLVTMCRTCHEWVHSKNNVNHDYIE